MSRVIVNGKKYNMSHVIEPVGPHPFLERYEKDYIIEGIMAGSGCLRIREYCYDISAGDVIILRPNERYLLQINESNPHERFAISVSARMMADCCEMGVSITPLFLSGEVIYKRNSINEPYLRELAARCDRMAATPSALAEAQLYMLILFFTLLLYEEAIGKTLPIQSKADQSKEVLLAKICEFICSNPGAECNYDNLQKRFFVSRRFLSVDFPKYTGTNISIYILQIRLKNVIRLITQKGYKIERAAQESGFNSYAHFYKQFVRHYGCSPSDWFKQNETKT